MVQRINLDHMFDERIKACKLINAKFGLNIQVRKREVDINGTIHDRTKGTSEE